DEIDVRERRLRPDRSDGVDHHEQVADPFEPQEQYSLGRGPRRARCARPAEQFRRSEPGVGKPDQHALLPIGNLKMVEHYLISARSIITPSIRSSAPPTTSRGVQVVLSTRASMAPVLAERSRARASGISNV